MASVPPQSIIHTAQCCGVDCGLMVDGFKIFRINLGVGVAFAYLLDCTTVT